MKCLFCVVMRVLRICCLMTQNMTYSRSQTISSEACSGNIKKNKAIDIYEKSLSLNICLILLIVR